MKPVIVELRRRSVPNKWMWWTLAVLAAAVVAAGGVVAREWQQVQLQGQELRNVLASKATLTHVQRPASPVPMPYATSANAMLAEHTSPWPQALTAIEVTGIVGVTPVGFEFVTSEQKFRLEVSFIDYAKLLEYIDALNAGEPTMRWTLVQAQSSGVATAVIAGAVNRR